MAIWYVDTLLGNDANAGTSAGAPLATIGAVWPKGYSANETIYLKGTALETVTLAVASTGNLYGEIIGYGTTPGDNGMACIDAANVRPWCLDANSKGTWLLKNIELKAPTTAFFRNTGTLSIVLQNAKLTKGTGAAPLFSNNGGVFSAMNLSAEKTTFTNVAAGSANVNLARLKDCTLIGCASIPLGTFGGNYLITGNVFRDYTNTALHGAASSSNIKIERNTFYNFTGSGCISLDSSALAGVNIGDNIFSVIGGTAVTVSATASESLTTDYNSFHSCTTRYGNSRPDGASDATLGASPFSSTVTLALSALNEGSTPGLSRGAVQYAGGGGGGGMPVIGSRIGGGVLL